MDDPEVQKAGAFFVADVGGPPKNGWAWYHAKLRLPTHEFESGYFMWDRVKSWEGIKWTHWFCEHHQAWTKLVHGDKCLPQLAFGTSDTPYVFATTPEWTGSGIRHRYKDHVLCEHQMGAKRGEAKFFDPKIYELFAEVKRLR